MEPLWALIVGARAFIASLQRDLRKVKKKVKDSGRPVKTLWTNDGLRQRIEGGLKDPLDADFLVIKRSDYVEYNGLADIEKFSPRSCRVYEEAYFMFVEQYEGAQPITLPRKMDDRTYVNLVDKVMAELLLKKADFSQPDEVYNNLMDKGNALIKEAKWAEAWRILLVAEIWLSEKLLDDPRNRLGYLYSMLSLYGTMHEFCLSIGDQLAALRVAHKLLNFKNTISSPLIKAAHEYQVARSKAMFFEASAGESRRPTHGITAFDARQKLAREAKRKFKHPDNELEHRLTDDLAEVALMAIRDVVFVLGRPMDQSCPELVDRHIGTTPAKSVWLLLGSVENPTLRRRGYDILADGYFLAGRLKRALVFSARSRELLEKTGSEIAKARSLESQGLLFAAMGLPKTANRNIQQARSAVNEAGFDTYREQIVRRYQAVLNSRASDEALVMLLKYCQAVIRIKSEKEWSIEERYLCSVDLTKPPAEVRAAVTNVVLQIIP